MIEVAFTDSALDLGDRADRRRARAALAAVGAETAAHAGAHAPGPRRRRRRRRTTPTRRAARRATRWSRPRRASRCSREPPTACRCCSPTPTPAWSPPCTPGGRGWPPAWCPPPSRGCASSGAQRAHRLGRAPRVRCLLRGARGDARRGGGGGPGGARHDQLGHARPSTSAPGSWPSSARAGVDTVHDVGGVHPRGPRLALPPPRRRRRDPVRRPDLDARSGRA